jgi:Fe-S cluster assembly protein SufD
VQAWGSATQSFQIDNTCGGRDALISSVNAAVGSRRARLENCVRIDGEGADVRLYGISVATGEQEFDQRTLQIHAAGHAKSDLLFKNALLGKARTIFSGLIKVAPDAQRTDAYQTNRNLLLSPDAEADSLPGLEIEANDVKCSHGATTGQVSPEELFYLRARGIPLAAAQELLAQGFLEEVLAKVGHAEAAEAVRGMLREKFPQA